MSDFRYDTYCGLYCGACEIMLAFKKGAPANIAPQIRTLMPPNAEVKCHGCKTDTVFINCAVCPIRNCAKDKKIENCVECGEFPCIFFKESEETKELLRKLPHLKEIPANLKTIKEKGVSYWLSEQERKWKCPNCGTNFSWYAAECSKCGKKLK